MHATEGFMKHDLHVQFADNIVAPYSSLVFIISLELENKIKPIFSVYSILDQHWLLFSAGRGECPSYMYRVSNFCCFRLVSPP